MEEITTNNRQQWNGKYKGIYFEVVKWKSDYQTKNPEHDNGYMWNYYLFVKPRKLKTTKSFDGRRVDYWKMYQDVEMHGDITFWCRIKHSNLGEVDKIGCDYAHIGDYEYGNQEKLIERDLDEILIDVKNSIDNLPEDLKFTTKSEALLQD